MTNVPEIFENLMLFHSATDACVAECAAMLTRNLVAIIDGCPGKVTVRMALQIWGPRQQSAAKAGLEACGFENTLERLSKRPPEETILEYVLKGHGATFVVFVDSNHSAIIGCIRVRGGSSPSNSP
jgi:hypothetical protein